MAEYKHNLIYRKTDVGRNASSSRWKSFKNEKLLCFSFAA